MTDPSPRRLLDLLRGDPRTWTAVAFVPADDDTCANAATRAAVLRAILHDPRPGDHALLRRLVEQEALAHEYGWGLAPALYLATFLLAEHRRVDDAALQWAARTANFDTHSGLDLWPLLAGGVTATRASIAASADPHREEILDDLARPPYAEAHDADVERWLTYQRDEYYKVPRPDAPRSDGAHPADARRSDASAGD
ncbi:hypothetical protein [Embleya sp. NBC_00896]|uniref:hypothetical protein n=1 Tax=Embleya sp. NBC_00896 TaxID=2975961 RepID=UPI0038683F35|nr:hypothetical protein OG928_26770 [Embleya sp. NBC_00896]